MTRKMAISSYLDVLTAVILMFIASEVYGQDCPALQKEKWSYQGANGPASWGSTYEDCNGDEQSPIRISETGPSSAIKGLKLFNYEKPISKAKVLNNGHTIKVTPGDGIDRKIIGELILTQLHFHWGSTSDKGAEHNINGSQYAMEMHLVHTDENDLTAVIGVFFNEEDDDNDDLQPIIDALSDVQYKDDESDLKSSFTLSNFVSDGTTDYVAYGGSFTTPPCTEGVFWHVIITPKGVGTAQMNQFRQLYAVKKEDADVNCKLVDNFRPVQPLNGRPVEYPRTDR